ncbi:MAG: transcriptional repressor [Oscillospiraceae bacterium]|nr:transcriptional repressor [Oscillospiraceae bacterium]
MILKFLQQNKEQHMTATELLYLLTENGTPMGAATVYRQLEKLEAEGRVRRYVMDDRGSACWQYLDEHTECHQHFHLKCTACGTLYHLACEHLQEITAHVGTNHAFQIDLSRTVFYGICKHCQGDAVQMDTEGGKND